MQKYRKKHLQPMEPWTNGYDMKNVSVSAEDRLAGSPKEGDMIAVNPHNTDDKWLVAKAFFEAIYEKV